MGTAETPAVKHSRLYNVLRDFNVGVVEGMRSVHLRRTPQGENKPLFIVDKLLNNYKNVGKCRS